MSDNIITLGIDPKDIKSLEQAQDALTRIGTAAGLTGKELESLSKSVMEAVKSVKSLDVAKSPFSATAASSKELVPHLQQANKELQQTAIWNAKLLSDRHLVNQITDTKSYILVQQKLNSEIERQASLKAQLRETTGVRQGDINLRKAKEETKELEKQLILVKRRNSAEVRTIVKDIDAQKLPVGFSADLKKRLEAEAKASSDKIKALVAEKKIEKEIVALRTQGIQAGKDLRAEQTRKRINLLLEEKSVEQGIATLRSKGLQAGKDLRAEATQRRIKLLLEEKSVERGMAALRAQGIQAGKDQREAKRTAELERQSTAVLKLKHRLEQLKHVDLPDEELLKMKLALRDMNRELRKGTKVNLGGAAKQLTLLEKKYKTTTKATKKLTEAQQIQHGVMRGLAGGLGKLWLSYGQGAIAIAAMGVAYSVTTAAAEQFREAVELDYLTRYAAAIDDAGISFDSLSASILEMEGTASTPVELAGGLRELIKAGEDTQKIFDEGLLKTLSKFSVVAEQDLAKTIQLAVTQVNAFGRVTQESAGYVLDHKTATEQMTAAVFSAAINFEDLTQSLKHTTELAVTVRASFDEILTGLVLMGKAGIKSSQAGTALRTSLTKLITPSEDVVSVFEAAGVAIEDAFDARGNINVKKALGLFKEVFLQLDDISRVKFSKDVFGLRAQKVLAIVSNLDDWDEQNKKILDSTDSIEKAYDKVRESLKVASKEFKSAFSREAMKDLLPVIKSITPAINLMTENLGTFIDGFKTGIAEITRSLPLIQIPFLASDLAVEGVLDPVKKGIEGFLTYVEELSGIEILPDILPEEFQKNVSETEGIVTDLVGTLDVATEATGKLSIATIKADKEYVKLKSSLGALMSSSDWDKLEEVSSLEGLKEFSGDFIAKFAEESSTDIKKLGGVFDELTLKTKEYFEATADERKMQAGKDYFKALEGAAKAYTKALDEVTDKLREMNEGLEDTKFDFSRDLQEEINKLPKTITIKAALDIGMSREEISGLLDSAGRVRVDRDSSKAKLVQDKAAIKELITLGMSAGNAGIEGRERQLELLKKAYSIAKSMDTSANEDDLEAKMNRAKATMDKYSDSLSSSRRDSRNDYIAAKEAYDAAKRGGGVDEGLQDAKIASMKELQKLILDVQSKQIQGLEEEKAAIEKFKVSSEQSWTSMQEAVEGYGVMIDLATKKVYTHGDVVKKVLGEALQKVASAGNLYNIKGDRIETPDVDSSKLEEVGNQMESVWGDVKTAVEEQKNEVAEAGVESTSFKDTTTNNIIEVNGVWTNLTQSVKDYAKEADKAAAINIAGDVVAPSAQVKSSELFNKEASEIKTPSLDLAKIQESSDKMKAMWAAVKESLEEYLEAILLAEDATVTFRIATVADLEGADIAWSALTDTVNLYSKAIRDIPKVTAPGSSGTVTGKALGGDVAAGMPYEVGEVGKELFIPNVSGTIIPNNKLESNTKGSNKTVDINLNFNGENIQLQGTQPNVDSFVAGLERLKRRAA